jgi:hypothetical protein
MALRIKKDIDLKELEKYGFKQGNYYDNEPCWYYDNIGDLAGYDDIEINEDREICLGFEPSPYFVENCLYDLIKADLVEKVED